MEINVDVRQKQLESLHEFITASRDKVQSILTDLNWTLTETNDVYSNCKVEPSHRVPQANLKRHSQKCALKKEGYDSSDEFLSEPKPPSKQSIHLDNKKKLEIFIENGIQKQSKLLEADPRTSNRLTSAYATKERLIIYNHVISATEAPPKVPEFNLRSSDRSAKSEDKKLTQAEIEVRERDARRRRMKYKPKNVYINKKNYTEVMKELIDGQMEEYTEWFRDQKRKKSRSRSKK